MTIAARTARRSAPRPGSWAANRAPKRRARSTGRSGSGSSVRALYSRARCCRSRRVRTVTWRRMRLRALSSAVGATLLVGLVLSGCGGTRLLRHTTTTTTRPASRRCRAPAGSGIPTLATRNTTRVDGSSPVSDAAGVALAVYPSQSSGSHPTAVTIAPTDDWEAAIAASVLMAAPIHAPVLLSGASALPKVTSQALSTLSPTGRRRDRRGAGAPRRRRARWPVTSRPTRCPARRIPTRWRRTSPRFQAAAAGRPSQDVVIASSASPAYAMPAAGWAAESGDPVLFVSATGVPAATRRALQADSSPHIYVLGPKTVIGPQIVRTLRRYGTRRPGGARGSRPPTRSRSRSTATRRARSARRARRSPARSAGRSAAPGTAIRC